MAPLSRLRDSVTQLHEQLEHPGSIDAADRESLEALLGDVVRVLEADGEGESAEHETLADQLREFAQDFEESHPEFTHAVGRVADALARLGI